MLPLDTKKILVLGPILPQWSEIKFIAETLKFLDDEYNIHFLDPLADLTDSLHPYVFLKKWQFNIQQLLLNYNVFFGFSLGGIILQQCFNFFEKHNKLIVLFSTPSFSDTMLYNRLIQIINLAKENLVIDAITQLNKYIYYPYDAPQKENILDPNEAAFRLINGLNYVLNMDSRSILIRSKVKYLHLIGEESKLVNYNNVLIPPSSKLIRVPHAGMRVMQNNLSYCMDSILQFLRGK